MKKEVLALLAILVFAIVIVATSVTYKSCSKPVEDTKVEIKKGDTVYVYVQGKTDTVYVEREKVVYKVKNAESKNNDSSYANFDFSEGDSIKLITHVTTYPKCDSIKQAVDFKYLDKYVIRVDTIKSHSTDTLKITKTVIEKPSIVEDNNTYIGIAIGVTIALAIKTIIGG